MKFKFETFSQQNQCPSCRKTHIQHFQLFFETEDIEGAKCLDFTSYSGRDNKSNEATRQLGVIIKKLDNLSQKVQTLSYSNPSTSQIMAAQNHDVCAELLSQVEKLQKENADLKEIHEMEEIVLANTEREIVELKDEVKQRNDIINSLQLQNDNLRDETKELRLNARAVRNEDLVKLFAC